MFFKKRKVIDLTEKYRRDTQRVEGIRDSVNAARQQNAQAIKEQHGISSGSGSLGNANFDFLRNLPTESRVFQDGNRQTENYGISANEEINSEESVEERRKKLTKRILDMTEKIEDLSNQIYRMQQRLEVVERKLGTSGQDSKNETELSNTKNFEGVFG